MSDHVSYVFPCMNIGEPEMKSKLEITIEEYFFVKSQINSYIDQIIIFVKSDTVHHNCNFFNVALGVHNRVKISTKLNLDFYESMIFFSLGCSEIKIHTF